MRNVLFPVLALCLFTACESGDAYGVHGSTGPMAPSEDTDQAMSGQCVPNPNAAIEPGVQTLVGDHGWDGCARNSGMILIGQEQDHWCWIAVADMVADAYGIRATQCGLASHATGVDVDACCTDPTKYGCNV